MNLQIHFEFEIARPWDRLQSSSEQKYNQDNQHNAADADTTVWAVGVITAASAEEQE
jgi:hypothetical protein